MRTQDRHTKPTSLGWKTGLLAIALCFLFQGLSLAFTVEVVQRDGTPITGGFRWLVEEDNTNQSTPQVPSAFSIGLDIHKSHAPVVANGEAVGSSATIALPADKPYFVSVLPNAGYSMSGKMVATGQGSVKVVVQPYNPGIPTAQITILVFEDNYSINNAPDFPNEFGLAGFTVVIDDTFGQVMMNAFGHMLGTTYQMNPDGSFVLDADGMPVVDVLGTGNIVTDADGMAAVKYLAPGKYGVNVVPPTTDPITGAPVAWFQTSTIEGSPTIDAWVKANEPPLFIERFGASTTHTAFGFVNPATLPWAVTPPVGGTGFISGTNRFNHFSRPPFLQGFFPGAPVSECWVGLNDPITGQGLIAVPCDENSNFLIEGVPPGTYELVTWDVPLDALFGFHSVVVPDGGIDLGNVLSFRWFGTLQGTVFNDLDQDGFMDEGEPGIVEQNINIRFRDGTIYQAQPTDVAGGYELSEVFPFFKWLVPEVDFARFKATGMTTAIDYGGEVPPHNGWTVPSFDKLTPQPQAEVNPNTNNNLSRTETGPVLTQAMHLFLGQTNVIDWGKAPYGPNENGGISGVVLYAVTRAEDDPRFAAGEEWEPGIPRVQMNLYFDQNQDGVIDDLNGDGLPTPADVDNHPFGWQDGGAKGPEDMDRNANGVFDVGDAIQIATTDSWDDDPPTGCVQTLPVVAGQQANECFDNFGTWNQVRPGLFDGGYAFDSYFPRGMASGSSEVDGLPTATYIVEAATPFGYDLVKEEDKNVDFGDPYTPSPQLLAPICVGDLHTVPALLTFQTGPTGAPLPGVSGADLITSPFEGQDRPLCDRKQIDVLNQDANAAADFFFFTEVPKAARAVGFSNNDLSAEFDTTSPIFGEKASPSWVPVSFRDFEGNEVARVYTDEYGAYNALLPSTYTVSIASPSGVSPNMLTLVLNDPGPIPDPANPGQMITDPNYDPNFSIAPWTFQYYAGRTSYLDTPVVPVAAFAGVPGTGVDTQPADATPVIYSVEGPDGGPVICNDNLAVLTITSVANLTTDGLTLVPNPDYDPNDPNSVAQIKRDFGFGDIEGSVFLGGIELTVLDWSNKVITATVPGTVTDDGTLIVTRDNGQTSDGVTVATLISTGPDPTCSVALADVLHVPGDYDTIQLAIDNANDGHLILVAPGTYNENVIMYKPVRLQGSGAASTFINASPVPLERVADWHTKLRTILGLPLDQPDEFVPKENPGVFVTGKNFNDPTPLWPDSVATNFSLNDSRIDGFTISGAVTGGGIYVHNDATNLVISNNLITNNQGQFGGGIIVGIPDNDPLAIDLNSPSVPNTDLQIKGNRVVKNGGIVGGGGIVLHNDSTNYLVEGNLVSANLSRFSGAGIAHSGLSDGGVIRNNRVLFNEVFFGLILPGSGNGGGIYVGGDIIGGDRKGAGNVLIDGNLIQGNLAGSGHGGGIAAFALNGEDVIGNPTNADPIPAEDFVKWYTLTVTNNMIVNNVAALGGGGISLQDVAAGTIVNNTIARNDSTSTAALAFPAGNLDVSTPRAGGILSFAHSTALAAGFGVGLEQTFSDPLLENNIIWENRSFFNDSSVNGNQGGLLPASQHATSNPDDLNLYPDLWDLQVLDTGDQLAPDYSILTALTDLFGDYSGVSNLTDNPAFVMPYSNILESATVLDEGGNAISVRFLPLDATAGDYHLGSACSPAIDVGLADNAPGNDLDSEVRPNPNTALVDIGADELYAGAPLILAETTLLQPNGGELVPAGSTYTLKWGAPDTAVAFDFAYNLGPGTPWVIIDEGVIDSCYLWEVPNDIRNVDQAQLGVTARDDVGDAIGTDMSDAPFAIDIIALLTPNGGETLFTGSTVTIVWTERYAPDTTKVALWFQQDAGSAWAPIGIVGGGEGRFDWDIPNTADSLAARVGLILYDADGNVLLTDYSDATFSIVVPIITPPAPTPAPAAAPLATTDGDTVTTLSTIGGPVAVLSGTYTLDQAAASDAETGQVTLLIPNGDETFASGDMVPLLWISPATDSQVTKVELLLQAGPDGKSKSIATLDVDTEYYEWTVPEVESAQDGYLLQIRRIGNDGKVIDSDVSDGSFAIEPGN